MESTSTTEKASVSTAEERDLVMSMRKLDLIKELGTKQSQFQRLQSQLHQNTDLVSRENQVLREFRKELDMLVQERMSHIEELRLIHADINIMETTIKQAEEEKIRAMQESKRLLKDYHPVREQINKLREMLNLERLPDNDDDETALVTMQLIAQQQQQAGDPDVGRCSLIPPTVPDNAHELHPLVVPFHHHQSPQMTATGSTSVGGATSTSSHSQQQASALNVPKVIGGVGPGVDRATFRQQPPPMKTCQSCQQQIHRNAPICPICKAKSRSRNPKKPKRRHTDVHP